jgi:hypothetical protein
MTSVFRSSRIAFLHAFLLLSLFTVPFSVYSHAQHPRGNDPDCAICFVGHHFQADTPGYHTVDVPLERRLLRDFPYRSPIRTARIFSEALGRAPPVL